MKYLFFTMLLSVSFSCSKAQNNAIMTNDPAFAKTIDGLLKFSVPVISVDSLREILNQQVVMLDAREEEEYAVSHLPGAIHIGYKELNLSALEGLEKDSRIVVYCSIGYRSEKIAERLIKEGYHNIANLYGSIFEWVNQGYEIVTPTGSPTRKIHTYNKKWSKWVDDKVATKVW